MPPARAHLEYTLYSHLAEIEPPIWRRIVVPANLTLHQLHQVVQVTMGWTHSHLHQFIVQRTQESTYYGEPNPEDDYFHKDDRRVRLADIAPKEGATFVYEYDFGDSWRHEITVERITPTPKEDLPYPWCLDGQRACPPEDVGGASGYTNFLEAWRDRSHPEHREMREWVMKPMMPVLLRLLANGDKGHNSRTTVFPLNTGH